jgi:hypothetical protein
MDQERQQMERDHAERDALLEQEVLLAAKKEEIEAQRLKKQQHDSQKQYEKRKAVAKKKADNLNSKLQLQLEGKMHAIEEEHAAKKEQLRRESEGKDTQDLLENAQSEVDRDIGQLQRLVNAKLVNQRRQLQENLQQMKARGDEQRLQLAAKQEEAKEAHRLELLKIDQQRQANEEHTAARMASSEPGRNSSNYLCWTSGPALTAPITKRNSSSKRQSTSPSSA